MAKAFVDSDTCISCGVCVDSCPVQAIEMPDKALVDQDKCTSCEACVDVCPVQAISMK